MSEVNDITLQRQEKRFKQLIGIYKKFDEDCKTLLNNSVYLNTDLLRLAVQSYYEDIVRFETFTQSPVADAHKQAAYTIKWISKIRPVQILPDCKKATEFILYANSAYAIFAGLAFLDERIINVIPQEYHKFLLYTTQFRNISGKQLAGSIYLLEQYFKQFNPEELLKASNDLESQLSETEMD